MEKLAKKKSFWETLMFWKKENPKVEHDETQGEKLKVEHDETQGEKTKVEHDETLEVKCKVKRMTVMLIPRYAFHPEFFYRPAIIDFNQKKVNVFNKMPQLVNGENQYNGFVVGALENEGNYVYLAAFESDLKCGDYKRVCLDTEVEKVAFYVSKPVYETFSSNYDRLDLRHKLVYCDDTYNRVPDKKNLVLTDKHPLTFREAKYEKFSVNSYDSKLWLWVAFDAEGNMLDPHEYDSWKPYEYTLKYVYVSASGKYLYYDCDYTDLDSVLALKQKYPDFCSVIRHKKTGEIGYLGYVGDVGSYSLRYEELKHLLKDQDVAKKLGGKRVFACDTLSGFVICNGKLRATDYFDTQFEYYNLKGENVDWHDDYELIDLDTYLKDLKSPCFKIADNDSKYFVCGRMRQKSSGSIFYLTTCNGKFAVNYFDLSKAELKTLLKDDKVAVVFEGKSFMVSDKGCKCYKIFNRKPQRIYFTMDPTYFILLDENGVIFEEKYDYSDWELVDPESYVKSQKDLDLKSGICGKIQHKQSGETYFLKMYFDEKNYSQEEIFKEYDGLGLLLPLEELQKLLKNEKVAKLLEGKTFWSYLASDENHKFIEAYEVSQGELKRLMLMEAQGNRFQLLNKKGFLVTKDFMPSEWKVVEPLAEKTA